MLDILMRGVSTGQYRSVIPEMADTVGVSKSSVSRQMIEASEAEVETLPGRRFDELKLEDLVARGVNPDQKRLFVTDGSKALRTAINPVFGSQHPVQRCRAHKLRNVSLGGHLKTGQSWTLQNRPVDRTQNNLVLH